MRDFHLSPVPPRVIEPPTVAEMLEFERDHADDPKRATLTQQRWGWRDTRFEQAMQQALKTPAALAHDAELTHRLIRIRDSRTRTRASRAFRPTQKEQR